MNPELLNLEPYLLLPLALVVLMMALPILSRKFYGNVPGILPGELARRLGTGEDIAILDLRPKKQFDFKHIEGAVNVSAQDVEQKLDGDAAALAEFKAQPLVFVCASDLHSTRMASKLVKKGFANAMVLTGGINKWKRDHLPVVATGATPAEAP
ncbi:MAG: rhodanese-like domain-containing protein [Rhodospirillaceae bacterium]|nr:rhodanese-like domain-containing protein [Rhodospirillaceae bacterium]